MMYWYHWWLLKIPYVGDWYAKANCLDQLAKSAIRYDEMLNVFERAPTGDDYNELYDRVMFYTEDWR